MPDLEDDGFTEENFKNLDIGDDPAPVTPPSGDPQTPPATPPASAEPPKGDPKPPEEPKKDDKPAEQPKEETPPAPADPAKKPEDPAKPPETPETPPVSEAPAPLTKDDVSSVVRDLLTSERMSGKELDNTTKEVLDAYYPEGLSNVLIDERTGKELRTPADVVEVTNGEMSTEQAAQWLMNEQFKMDQQVNTIKNQAKEIAETTVNFKRDAITALQKYDPLFKAYPHLQTKVYDKLMKLTKVDKERNVILSAPDVLEHYDDYLEPYQLAFEHATGQPSTAPTPPPGGDPPKPGAEDRMDEGGDGGPAPVDDPNNFAQQVVKELAKPL